MFRYTIRTLLVATLVFAAVLAIVFDRARAQRRGRQWVHDENGHVTFSHKYDSATRTYDHTSKLAAPVWLVDLVGIDYFDSVDCVTLDNQTVDDLEPITDLRSLRSLAIVIEIDDDLDFSPLMRMPNLESLYLDYTGITAERLAGLRRMLPHVAVDSAEHPVEIRSRN